MAHWLARIGLTPAACHHSARTAVATVLSMLLARLLKLPEFYWAPISTIVILLSTINPLALAWQRFTGTALGAVLGALISSAQHSEWTAYMWLVYGLGIFIAGILSALLRIGTAYRFAAITLTIVLLASHGNAPWIIAWHRFVEVSLGILVALAVTVIWKIPE